MLVLALPMLVLVMLVLVDSFVFSPNRNRDVHRCKNSIANNFVSIERAFVLKEKKNGI